ncbi:MAG: RDD family protein [Phycisphaerales bacterium]|nr:RDD family protein [Phycisphaerales bacterium]
MSPCVGISFAYFAVDWFTGLDQWPGRATGMDNMLPGALAIGLYVLHTGLSELFTGRTLGKMICGLRVVNLQGQPPHLWQVLGRNALKVLDLVAWPLLILPIISPQRQRLGDMMAKTLVVMPTPPKPPITEQDQLDE